MGRGDIPSKEEKEATEKRAGIKPKEDKFNSSNVPPFDDPKNGKNRLKPEWSPIKTFLVENGLINKLPDALVRANLGYKDVNSFILTCTYDEFLTVLNCTK